jgi:hypothetical protein
MNVFGQVKHSRRKVNQKREEQKNEESAKEFKNTTNSCPGSPRQHIPNRLEQNHIEKDADVTEQLAFRA